MMTLRKKLPYGSIGNMAEWISLPYNSSDAMIILKPKDGSNVENIMQHMQAEDVDNIIQSMYDDNYANVNLTMPKFKTDSLTNLVSPLQKMGVQKAFSRESQINKLASEPLQVSNAVQQASMEVNEEVRIKRIF